MNEARFRKDKEMPTLFAVSRRAGQALVEFDMIREGDRIAVAVSGGKDSLSLLHVLRDRRRVSPVKFDFTAAHIDFEFSDFNPQILIGYLEKEGFPYLVAKADSLKDEKHEDIDCFRWSWNRRKALFQLADREGFNKIAFGHHMDDIVETILLNQFYRGEIAAMKPRQELFDGKLVIIRPLAYVREEAMVRLAQELALQLTSGKKERTLSLIERVFVYMPLMHAEDIQAQRLSVGYFAELVEESRGKNPGNSHYYSYSLDYVNRHCAIVECFGRFPHRNKVLGRTSTPEEIEFLKKSGSGFLPQGRREPVGRGISDG
ncbi:MAG: hypothetical protein A2705_04610 [Omnitrophica WOR_2 bacterium RIFCSPHIGHO2_01_FULL_52_10]|nr:MAG: hypothetical protein A2705_04610 [Omnitrophica WOR_2 bacterium RIFCSPHIGHO2_01_FULL_52_10]